MATIQGDSCTCLKHLGILRPCSGVPLVSCWWGWFTHLTFGPVLWVDVYRGQVPLNFRNPPKWLAYIDLQKMHKGSSQLEFTPISGILFPSSGKRAATLQDNLLLFPRRSQDAWFPRFLQNKNAPKSCCLAVKENGATSLQQAP